MKFWSEPAIVLIMDAVGNLVLISVGIRHHKSLDLQSGSLGSLPETQLRDEWSLLKLEIALN